MSAPERAALREIYLPGAARQLAAVLAGAGPASALWRRAMPLMLAAGASGGAGGADGALDPGAAAQLVQRVLARRLDELALAALSARDEASCRRGRGDEAAGPWGV